MFFLLAQFEVLRKRFSDLPILFALCSRPWPVKRLLLNCSMEDSIPTTQMG